MKNNKRKKMKLEGEKMPIVALSCNTFNLHEYEVLVLKINLQHTFLNASKIRVIS